MRELCQLIGYNGLKPPISSMNELKPHISSRNELKPHISSMNELKPPISSMNELKPHISSMADGSHLEAAAICGSAARRTTGGQLKAARVGKERVAAGEDAAMAGEAGGAQWHAEGA
jgi:hypothetical protein